MRLVLLAAAAVLLAPSVGLAQFPPLVDDFEGGPTDLENWSQGPLSSGGLANVAGGPPGSTRYMQVTAVGGFGANSRLTVFNRVQWLGDYIAAGVTAVEMDLLYTPGDGSPATLSMRVAFKEALSALSPGYSSTDAITLLPNTWQHVVFPITADTMTPIGGPDPFATFMASPAEMRILHSVAPALNGDDEVVAVVGVDNIRPVPVPEPAGVLAVAAAVAGAAGAVRRRRK